MTEKTTASTVNADTEGIKLVDVEVLGKVHRAATARVKLLRAYEKRANGAATTTLAMVGRKALVDWEAPDGPPDTKRPMRRGAGVKTFRFNMPEEIYVDRREAIHAAGQSVAGVVQDGLERFAKTGEY